MNDKQFRGIIAYPVTPFVQGGERIDVDTLARLIDRLIDSGAHAIAPLGSTGESAYLNDTEWDEVAERSIHQVRRRVPVVVGISDLTTQKAVRRAKFAQQAGSDAVMVLPMAYWKLSEREIYRHYSQIASAIDVPIMVYNNPATSGIDMSPEFIARLVREIDNVSMVKESSGDIQRMHRLTQLSDGQIPLYNGCNPLALEAFVAGAVGWCTAAPNLIPELNIRLYEAVVAGQWNEARALFYRQLPLLQFILRGGLPTTIKAGLNLCGMDAGAPRLPLEPLDAAGRDSLAQILQALT